MEKDLNSLEKACVSDALAKKAVAGNLEDTAQSRAQHPNAGMESPAHSGYRLTQLK